MLEIRKRRHRRGFAQNTIIGGPQDAERNEITENKSGIVLRGGRPVDPPEQP
jgi:hypothetical protein